MYRVAHFKFLVFCLPLVFCRSPPQYEAPLGLMKDARNCGHEHNYDSFQAAALMSSCVPMACSVLLVSGNVTERKTALMVLMKWVAKRNLIAMPCPLHSLGFLVSCCVI